MSKRYIPQGAILICNQGRDMTNLQVTHNNNVNLYKVPYANELDKIPEENIPNFKKCKICGNCQMELLDWEPLQETVKLGGGRLIQEESKIKCLKGGEIKIYLNEQEAKEALKQTEYNKMSMWEKAKRVDWGRVGKTFGKALVVAAVGAAIFATGGALLAPAIGIMTANCAAFGVAVQVAGVAIKAYATYQTVKGVYETYKRLEATNWDIEEGLVVLAEHTGSALGGLAGGYIGGKLGGKLADKLYAKSLNYQKLKNGTLCFILGTLVATKYGLKKIEEIETGDEVYSYDELIKEKVLRKVRDVHEHITDTFVRIKTKTDEIFTTLEHPFYVRGKYILAGFLSVGMSLTTFSGEEVEIKEIEMVQYESPQKVYNFSIEGTENYYVGEEGILSHNNNGKSCATGSQQKFNATKEKSPDYLTPSGRKKVEKFIDNGETLEKHSKKYMMHNIKNSKLKIQGTQEHSNKTKGHWEAIVDKGEEFSKNNKISEVYLDVKLKDIDNEVFNGVQRPDITTKYNKKIKIINENNEKRAIEVREFGIYEVPSSTDTILGLDNKLKNLQKKYGKVEKKYMSKIVETGIIAPKGGTLKLRPKEICQLEALKKATKNTPIKQNSNKLIIKDKNGVVRMVLHEK